MRNAQESFAPRIVPLLRCWLGAVVTTALTFAALTSISAARSGAPAGGVSAAFSYFVLAFIIASLGVLPALLVAVILILAGERFTPALMSAPLRFTLIMALAGAVTSALLCWVALPILFHFPAGIQPLVDATVSASLGGVALGTLMARMVNRG